MECIRFYCPLQSWLKLAPVTVTSPGELILFVLFKYLINPLKEVQVALPIPTSVCSVFVSLNNDMAAKEIKRKILYRTRLRIKLSSVLQLPFPSDVLPTELSCPSWLKYEVYWTLIAFCNIAPWQHAISYEHTKTIRELSLKVDSREKVPCHTREGTEPASVLRWLLGVMLYQPNCIPPQMNKTWS